MIPRATGPFDVFNARFQAPESVGSSFVATPFLDQVAASTNSAILGPRGSGKTTLLKMLTLPALRRWKDSKRFELTERLDYLAAYIPASITWNADYRAFSSARSNAETSALLSTGLFRHNILLALLSSWEDAAQPEIAKDPALARFSLPIKPEAEATMARAIAALWELETRSSSVAGLKHSIAARIRQMQKLAVRAAYLGLKPTDVLDDAPYLASHFIDDAVAFRGFLAEHYGFNAKVALCFDELEIAAQPIAEAVMQAPRSIDQGLLVKFSAAPFVPAASTERGPSAATQQNDFRLVFLSSFSARETRAFSEALFQSLCRRYGVGAPSEEVLGRSFLDDVPAAGANRLTNGPTTSPYGNAGGYQRKFHALYQRDSTFRIYADRKGIDVFGLNAGSEKRRAADIRKVIWPVLVREEFLFTPEKSDNQGKGQRRLRSKSPVSDIYTGSGALFAICEGNPRWILGLLEPLVQDYADALGLERPAARRSLQKQSIEEMTAAYFALLSTVPASGDNQRFGSLVDLVDAVGQYFQNSILGPTFNPDPVLSFYVDAEVPPQTRELIGRGINIGAFVTAQSSRSRAYHVGDIQGLKVRLANIFAPRFKLPLAGGRTINLSTILARQADTKNLSLLDLFGKKI